MGKRKRATAIGIQIPKQKPCQATRRSTAPYVDRCGPANQGASPLTRRLPRAPTSSPLENKHGVLVLAGGGGRGDEEAEDGAGGGGRRHGGVRGAAGRAGRVHPRRRGGRGEQAGRPRLRHAHVQEIQGTGAAQPGAQPGVAAVRRRARQGLVRRRGALRRPLLQRRQPPRLLLSRHDPLLLSGQPAFGDRADLAGGAARPRRRALLAGRDPVQRERAVQGRPQPAGRRQAVRARGGARPRGRAPRARPLRPRRPPPPRAGQPPRDVRGLPGPRAGRGAAAPRHRRAAARVPAQRLRLPHGGGLRAEGARGQRVPGRVVRGPARRRGRGVRAAAVLAPGVRPAGDAEAGVPAVLGVQRGHLLLPRVPGAALEGAAQAGVRAGEPVARRRQRRCRGRCCQRQRRRRCHRQCGRVGCQRRQCRCAGRRRYGCGVTVVDLSGMFVV